MEIVLAKRFSTITAYQSTFFFFFSCMALLSSSVNKNTPQSNKGFFFSSSEQKHFKCLHILTQKTFNYVRVIFLSKSFFLIKILVANILKIYFTVLLDEIFIFSNHHFHFELQGLKHITHFFFSKWP